MTESHESSLLKDLPRLYRRDGGRVLDRIVAVAQAFVDALGDRLASADAPSVLAALQDAGYLVAETRAAGVAGTPRELVQEIVGTLPPPAIWSGRSLERTLGPELVVREPAFGRAAVLAWISSDLGAALKSEAALKREAGLQGEEGLESEAGRLETILPERLKLDAVFFPVGVLVQAVVLEAPPAVRVPVPGMRLAGSIFWEHESGTSSSDPRDSSKDSLLRRA